MAMAQFLNPIPLRTPKPPTHAVLSSVVCHEKALELRKKQTPFEATRSTRMLRWFCCDFESVELRVAMYQQAMVPGTFELYGTKGGIGVAVDGSTADSVAPS